MRSSRLPRNLSPTPLALAVAEHRASARPLIDLTETNPTRAGFEYPADLLRPLADPAGLEYDPQPLGSKAAREAVAADYLRRGLRVEVERIALTASTSESYSLLFKALCDPGDTVLVPAPSYPLFEHLTALEGIAAAHYELDYHGEWRINLDSVARAIGERTRAVLVVSPNNPTGSILHRDDLSALADLCRRRGCAIVGDEVFADYPLDPAPGGVSVLEQEAVAVFSLGGLSKSAGLPQVKLGWIAARGAGGEFHRMFEMVADTYLSVSTPVQSAAPALIESGAVVRAQIARRTARNLAALRDAVAGRSALSVLPVQGGWSAVIRVPALAPEERLVLALLREDGVLVHPGYFFDFAHEAFLVVSLLVEPAAFDAGIARVIRRAAGAAA